MTNIYYLLRTKEYSNEKWNNECELKLENAKSKMIAYMSNLVDNVIKLEKWPNSNENQNNMYL